MPLTAPPGPTATAVKLHTAEGPTGRRPVSLELSAQKRYVSLLETWEVPTVRQTTRELHVRPP